MCRKNSLEHQSPHHLESLRNFEILDYHDGLPFASHGGDIYVWGVPYMNNDRDTKKAVIKLKKQAKKEMYNDRIKILLLHTDLPGAKTPEGFVINETEHFSNKLDKFFKPWDLVLCGHIHLPQRLSKKCFMLGPPIHQTAGDEGHDFGYWEVYSDKTMKFKPLKGFPKFITLKKGEEPKDDGNYYIKPDEVLVEEETESGDFNINNSKKSLATAYIKTRQIKSKAKTRALIKILNDH